MAKNKAEEAKIKKEIARRIRKARALTDIKQIEMAERLGIAIGTYSHYETGRSNPSVPRLHQIADILDVNIYDLVPPNKLMVEEPNDINEIWKEINQLKKNNPYSGLNQEE